MPNLSQILADLPDEDIQCIETALTLMNLQALASAKYRGDAQR